MSELRKKLKIEDLNPVDSFWANPNTNTFRMVNKKDQTYEMAIKICQISGLELKRVSKKLITNELCEIAVQNSGFALSYIPERLIKQNGQEWLKKLCVLAVENDGGSISRVPENLIDKEIVELAIFGDTYSPRDDYLRNPIAYVPKNLLTKELILHAVSYAPYSIKDIPRNKITKEISRIAVSGEGKTLKYIPERFINEELISIAVANNIVAIRLIPEKYINAEKCKLWFDNNYLALKYIPDQYKSKDMCLSSIKNNQFIVSSSQLFDGFNEDDDTYDYIKFDDFPESIRNDREIIDAIIELYSGKVYSLLAWNQIKIENQKDDDTYRFSSTDDDIKPLQKKTVTYLNSKIDKTEITRPRYNMFEQRIIDMNLSQYMPSNDKEYNSIVIDNSEKNELIPKEKDGLSEYLLSDDELGGKIYYISDIHIEHHLYDEKEKIKDLDPADAGLYIFYYIKNKVKEMCNVIGDKDAILLVGGDVSDSIPLTKIFYMYLAKYWEGKGNLVVSVLGNHELWDGTDMRDWMNPNFSSRPIDEIVNDYKTIIEDCYYKSVRKDDAFASTMFMCGAVLENEVLIRYKTKSYRVISEKDILEASVEDLRGIFNDSTLIILGGIGYSGLNSIHNSDAGLYRKAITSRDEDINRSEKFKKVYDKVKRCAYDKRVIVLTHTQVSNWTTDECCANWVYVNGHTHQNLVDYCDNGAVIFSNNQVGYKEKNWNLKSFVIDRLWYDPFKEYNDGIYKITSDQYREFNIGRGIDSNGCAWPGILYMLKRNNNYMFLLESSTSLCLLSGGKRSSLKIKDINYYFNNLDLYSNNINTIIQPYKNKLLQISEEVKKIGGYGRIHGCIVDISFLSHIYLNPLDGKITTYWATDIMSRFTYGSLIELLEDKESENMVQKYYIECELNNIPLLSSNTNKRKNNLVKIPKWMFGTDIYDPSRKMRSLQYIWEKGVIRIWNDDILTTELPGGEHGISEKK